MKKYTFLFLILPLMMHNVRAKVVEIDSASHLDETLKNSNAIIKFARETCPSCRAVKPGFIRVSDDHDLQDIVFINVDVEKNPAIGASYGVQGVPTFVYKTNNKELYRHTGTIGQEELKSNIQRTFNIQAKGKKTAYSPAHLWETICNGCSNVADAIKHAFNWA